MLIETLRIVATALATGSIGVNTQLPGVPRDAGDPVPPDVVYFTDETNNLSLAMNKAPNDVGYPMILATILSPVSLQGEVVSGVRSGEVSVLVQYIATGQDTQNKVRDAYYTMRAVEKCIHQLESNDYANTLRTRNGIHVQELLSMTHQLVDTYEQDNKIVAGMILTYLVRDFQT